MPRLGLHEVGLNVAQRPIVLGWKAELKGRHQQWRLREALLHLRITQGHNGGGLLHLGMSRRNNAEDKGEQ